MAKVICTLPNASAEISGVQFVEHDEGMISEDISDDLAAEFASITGYKLAAGQQKPVKTAEEDPALAELRAKAESLGIKVDSRWKVERLAAEIDKKVASADGE